MRVKFIVTGDLEKKSIVPSVQRMFGLPATGGLVEFVPPRKVDGCTTAPLPPFPEGSIPTPIQRLATALVAEVDVGASGQPADLVVGIDDLELANRSNPRTVLDWLRSAVDHEILRLRSSLPAQTRLRDLVREKCSFHFLVPMVEAYFFPDRSALAASGVASTVNPQLANPDAEDFLTDDPGYLLRARVQNSSHFAAGRSWFAGERHPKHYLEYLVGLSDRIYVETQGGAAALGQLDWKLGARQAQDLQFARSLFEDLAQAFGLPNPLGPGVASPLTWPAKAVPAGALCLRNL